METKGFSNCTDCHTHMFHSLKMSPQANSEQIVRRKHSTNILSSETTGPIKAKFHTDPQWAEEMKVSSPHQGHMTKMAATPIYDKNTLKIFSGTKGPLALGLGMQHWGHGPNEV